MLYHLEGRTDEIRELIQQSWGQSANPAIVLRQLYVLDDSAFPVDHVRKTLANADPNDDRVWLGQANLAAWTGRLDESSRWLARCAERRPHDEPVWRARLALARSAADAETVSLAADHLSLARFTKAEVLALRAWLAARKGDVAIERNTLASLVTEDPGDIRRMGSARRACTPDGPEGRGRGVSQEEGRSQRRATNIQEAHRSRRPGRARS